MMRESTNHFAITGAYTYFDAPFICNVHIPSYYFLIAAAAAFVLLAAAAAPGVYASTQGSELGFKQGEFYGDPDRPSEQSNFEGDLACYEAGASTVNNGEDQEADSSDDG